MKHLHGRRRRRPRLLSPISQSSPKPELIFSPAAWLKWQFFCHAGDTEVAGFGLSSPRNPLYLDDLLVIRQRATSVTVAFDDHAVADLFDELTDLTISPSRFARIWLHTHPGSSVTPSSVDESTFSRCFGSTDWGVMGILGRTGKTYARLRFNAGPGIQRIIPVRVDWSLWPDVASDLPYRLDEWRREYETLVEKVEFRLEPWTSSWFESLPKSGQFNPSPGRDSAPADQFLIPSHDLGDHPNVLD